MSVQAAPPPCSRHWPPGPSGQMHTTHALTGMAKFSIFPMGTAHQPSLSYHSVVIVVVHLLHRTADQWNQCNLRTPHPDYLSLSDWPSPVVVVVVVVTALFMNISILEVSMIYCCLSSMIGFSSVRVSPRTKSTPFTNRNRSTGGSCELLRDIQNQIPMVNVYRWCRACHQCNPV